MRRIRPILSEPPEALSLLQKAGGALIGVDEAGRGPLAGPVIAAAVLFPPHASIPGVEDSKRLSPKERDLLFVEISKVALGVGIGTIGPDVIDRVNILRATHQAMLDAVAALPTDPGLVLVDGLPVPGTPWPQLALVGGDGLSLSIAAASIVAKVTRDRLMCDLDLIHPGYGFARHKGYCTPQHLDALRRLGPCSAHRTSFAPVREALSPLPSLPLFDGDI
jgi:ribonuclease HII